MSESLPTTVRIILEDIQRSHDRRDGGGHALPIEVDVDYCFDELAEPGEHVSSTFTWEHYGLSYMGELVSYAFEVDVDSSGTGATMTWTHVDGEEVDSDHDFSDAFAARFPALWASMLACPEAALDELRHRDQEAAEAACSPF